MYTSKGDGDREVKVRGLELVGSEPAVRPPPAVETPPNELSVTPLPTRRVVTFGGDEAIVAVGCASDSRSFPDMGQEDSARAGLALSCVLSLHVEATVPLRGGGRSACHRRECLWDTM